MAASAHYSPRADSKFKIIVLVKVSQEYDFSRFFLDIKIDGLAQRQNQHFYHPWVLAGRMASVVLQRRSVVSIK
jgi:hypothetical protein